MTHFDFTGFPRGWFVVAYSDDIEAGATKPLRYFGRDLVIWRGEEGAVQVLDAFCPHLGAHLGHGGRVKNNHIVCPFHAWEFDGQGTCAHIPYAKKIPPKAKIKSWPVQEKNGVILVWYAPDNRPPEYEIPILPEFGTSAWSPWTPNILNIATQPKEIIENIADKAHFPVVHGTHVDHFENEFVDHMAIQRTAGVAYPRQGGEDHFSLTATYFGPGYMITKMDGVIPSLMLLATTPIDDENLDLRFGVCLPNLGEKTAQFSQLYADNLLIGFREDIALWENKVYRNRPTLCDGDGPLGRLRIWYQQFYE